MLRRVRDFADVKGDGHVRLDIAKHALDALNVDENGLDEMDARILRAILTKFKGGPVGLNTIATAIGEDSGTIEEVYEPYLIQQGFYNTCHVAESVQQRLGNTLEKASQGL